MAAGAPDDARPAPVLHITNGDSARLLLERSGVPGEVLAWREVLHEGPVPGGLSSEELRKVRARFLAGIDGDLERPRLQLALMDASLASAASRQEVVLWYEHDLFDQLQLLQILDRAAELRVVERLRLVQTERFLTDLGAADLRARFARRVPIAAGALELARRAWAAFRSPRPAALEDVLRGETSSLPYLGGALRRLLEELPAVGDGLSRTERQLLEAIDAGATSREAAFTASQEREEARFMGDATAFSRLAELAVTTPPLLVLAPLALTAAGARVLAGRADRISLCGIDRWLGGARLTGSAVPRWDRTGQRVV